ncbi:MAG: hypothetical protein JNM18_24135 [Planctomycetaceae bacterium]|nr:hypothetical protein [Planctomycetaceae bacterium]
MSSPLIPPRFLFRYSIPLKQRTPLWSGGELDDSYRLPNLLELDGVKPYAEVLGAWSSEGLMFAARVGGKSQPAWCRETRPDESDGLRVWIDTRDTHNIHRASRFCHHFVILPSGAGRMMDDPVVEQQLINRAKEHAKPVRPGLIQARRQKRVDGYNLETFIPAGALTGWDPSEHPKLGFTYAIVDRELGNQTLNCPNEFSYHDDPSLWATLELTA